jgi:ATP-dependent Clp protease ATP-binding subunit ClpA
MSAAAPPYNPDQLLSLESSLNSHILGQEDATKHIAQVLLNSAAGFKAPEKPRGVFLLTGPTGVGKTETALALAKPDVFYPSYSEENLQHYNPQLKILNMGEFQHSHEVAKLLGSPPGYLGHRETQPVMATVADNPRTVFVLDEVEKAHPEIFDALMGPFDKGKMTTGDNRELNFNQALFLLTSNHPAPDKILRKEFLNRMDAVLKYKPLQKEHYKVLIDRKLGDISAAMLEQFGVALSMDPKEIDRFATLLVKQAEGRAKGGPSHSIGFNSARRPDNPVMVDASREIQPGTGARELDRIIEKSLVPITRFLIKNQWKTGQNGVRPAQIVIKDLFTFRAEVQNGKGEPIQTISERSAAAVGR